MPAAIEIRHLTKDYGNLRAVDDLSFTAAAGEIIALLGPNGAGKSTLMNMITGYLAPSSGDIFILGRNIRDNRCPPRLRSASCRRARRCIRT